MKKRQWILVVVVFAVLAGFGWWGRNRIHFDFGLFRRQVALADWRMIALSTACIYVGFVFRSVRWALLLRHNKKVAPFALLGSQVMGFTAVALIGRVADLVRPYLVSRKTGLPVSSQIAVYIVERLLDAGSMALIFSVAMFWVPADEIIRGTTHAGVIAKLTHHSPFLALLVVRYGGLVLTLLGALFLVAVRLAGERVARFLEFSLGMISKGLAHAVGHKVRAFHAGLDTMRSFRDFAGAASLSISMWILIALAYFAGCKAFVASPALMAITPPKCILIMVGSGGASVLQLPVIGWFSQIGLVAVILAAVLGASPEAATACGATLLLSTFLSVIPAGLIWAQFDHVNLRKVTVESEHVDEALAAE
ncbi:MAG: lysylphosphatidylglycerol synthase transmembrane domain-containing protein [Terracidiphilus sp.]